MSRGLVAAAAVLVLGSGCARNRSGESERELVYRAETTLTVRVVNHSQFDAIVYLVHDGGRDRLGAVTAASAAAFPVRTRQLASGDFILLADPVGSPRVVSSERLAIAQGSTFTWTLESDFSRGTVLVQ
jgi:hypothetical protein